MNAGLSRFLTGAVAAVLSISTVPASAQMSPAQMKAQRDRAAQAADARARAERERTAAARARELAGQKQRTLRATDARRARVQKVAQYAGARNQAVATGKISAGYMIGDWAFDDPAICKPSEDSDFRTHFKNDGTYSGYEEGGSWSATEGNLIRDYTDSDEKKIHEVGKVAGLSLNSLVTELRGGHEIWFRCGEGGALVPVGGIPKSQFPEPSYEFYDGEWELASEIDKAWDLGRLPEAERAIVQFLASFPNTTRNTSRIKNYAGLYQWKKIGDLERAAVWFLDNYQSDPAGERAADSLLSLSQVQYELGDNFRYCLNLKKFKSNYPFEEKFRLAPRFLTISKLAPCA